MKDFNQEVENKETINNETAQNEAVNNEAENDEVLDHEPKKNKRNITADIKASFQSRKFKGGAYATATSLIVIIIVLLANFFVTKLDLKLDISKEGLYTISSATKDYLKDVKDDITIYYLAKTGNEDKELTEIVNKYPKLSKHIKVVYKDPVLYPNFASKYTDATVTENSVLVVNDSNDRAKYVTNSDMYQQEMNYQTYQTTTTGIDVEGQVTSAIQYVTTDKLPVMYTVEGHGETAVSSTLASSIAKINVTTNTLSTLTEKAIPDDCSILFINAPQKDFSEDEITMIKNYLAKGGDAIITANYGSEGLTNFNSLLNYYGIRLVDGIVLEGKQGAYVGQYVNYLVPTLDSSDITSSLMSKNTYVVVPQAVGIQQLDDVRSTTTITPLMTTSDKSFSKVNVNSQNVEKEDGDIAGPFSLGVAITEKYDNVESKIVVYGSDGLISDDMLKYNSIGNLDLFVNSVSYISDADQQSLAIPVKSTEATYLSITAAQANFWMLLVVVIIPVLILGCGGVICFRRRKK